ncbi:hypothetical protein PENTCL1PPCAC_26622 [Pristionchus entomophagus]|uniref:Protein kinase domain-containing protein n=1 Tax=Pristionchus entomophagus TaxID=358040 RepID=A0AAV5UDS4_9BILA|nr:hypothetical protein PENTCL1PPCAC_26622 [Pristionchus entomophagus]
MAPGASSSSTVAPESAPLLVPSLPSPPPSTRIPWMGTLPSTSTHSSPRIPLSRKRPNAAALPSIGLIPSKKTLTLPSTVLPSGEDERRKRERYESESSSQSSVSSQGSSSDESSSTGLPSHIIDFVLDEPSSASSTPGGATPQDPPAKQSIPSHSAVSAARECQVNAFHDRSVVIEKQPECARVIFCPEKTLGPYLESGSLINGYRIIGMGKDANALHLETNEVYNVKLITAREFQTTQQVAERLEMAHEMCKEYDWDVEELSEAVLPSEAEVVEEDLGEKGMRYILFTPFEYSNLHVMASNASATSQYGLPEEKVAAYFKQISRIIAFCHKIGIVVRDLKPRKLVFSNETQTKIRLSDVFDVAVCDTVSDDVVTEKFGSPALYSSRGANCSLARIRWKTR